MSLTSFAIAFNVLAVLALVAVFSVSGRVSAWLFNEKATHEGDGYLPYETGLAPIAPAYGRMSVLYYRFAVLFVVFDVDLAFVLPWALNRGALGLEQAVAFSVFIGLVGLMLAYFWRKGALECR